MSVNKCVLVGRLGKDPESRNGVVKFSLATDEKRNGEKQVAWHRIVAFKKIGEICQQYLRKGSLVFIEGKINYSEWEKDGQKQHATEIIANEMRMLDKAPRDEQDQRRSDEIAAEDIGF